MPGKCKYTYARDNRFTTVFPCTKKHLQRRKIGPHESRCESLDAYQANAHTRVKERENRLTTECPLRNRIRDASIPCLERHLEQRTIGLSESHRQSARNVKTQKRTATFDLPSLTSCAPCFLNSSEKAFFVALFSARRSRAAAFAAAFRARLASAVSFLFLTGT